MSMRFGQWMAATRPRFLTITVVAVGLGLVSALADGALLAWPTACLTLLGALAIHAGANLINDYHDRDADACNADALSPYAGGSRMIQDGVFRPTTIAAYGYSLMSLSIAIGIALMLSGHADLLFVGAAGTILAVVYSAPPLRLSARGWGEAIVVAAWLLVVVGADLVQRGEWSLHPFVAGLPVACLTAAILLINEFPDYDADASAGKRTLVVRLGRRAASWAYLALVFAAYAWILIMILVGQLPRAAAFGLFVLPLSGYAAGKLLYFDPRLPKIALLPAIRSTILAAHVLGMALMLALLVS
jgi:1,4-dihydroxy-2-naphthoate polyprenyltransferase